MLDLASMRISAVAFISALEALNTKGRKEEEQPAAVAEKKVVEQKAAAVKKEVPKQRSLFEV